MILLDPCIKHRPIPTDRRGDALVSHLQGGEEADLSGWGATVPSKNLYVINGPTSSYFLRFHIATDHHGFWVGPDNVLILVKEEVLSFKRGLFQTIHI